MPVYKVTIEWNQSVMGVSETYWTRGAVGVDNIVAQIQALLDARKALMYTNMEFVGVRVSVIGTDTNMFNVKRNSVFLIPGDRKIPGATAVLKVPPKGTREMKTDQDQPDQVRAVLQMAVTLSNGNTTMRYLSGIPDGTSLYEPGTVLLGRVPDWQKDWLTFRDLLQAMWAVEARSPSTTDPYVMVNGLVLQSPSPSIIGVQISDGTATTYAVGDKVQLRGFRACPGVRRSLNRIWRVLDISTSIPPTGQRTIWLRGSLKYEPNDYHILGTIQKVNRSLSNIVRVEHVRVGIHKRGRPSHAPRGRRLTRPSQPC